MEYIINLNEFADGAALERFNREMKRVLENIADPNTDPTKKRTLTMTVTLTADDARDVVATDVQVKSKLVPANSVGSKLLIDVDGSGNLVGRELKSGVKGQTYINDDGDVAEDTGKVIDFRKTK